MTSKTDTTVVKATSLEPGDMFTNGVEVTAVYRDTDGTWVETSDGGAGYMDGRYRIYRR